LYAYTNLLTPTNTGSGIAEAVYIAPVKWFAENGIKQPRPPYLAPGDEVIIKEAHEFLNDTLGFFKISLAPEKNSYEAKVVGDYGFQNLDHDLKVFIPGSYAAEHEQVRHLKNVPIIVLHQDANCRANLWYQLGTDWLESYMTVDFTTSVTKGGVKGYNGSINFVSHQVQLYAAAIKEIDPPLGLGEYNEDFSDDFTI
jgi:hypothetical protein